MTLLLLAAWLPARVVTCLQMARATKRDRTEKKGRGVVWEQEQCASANDWRTKNSQCACVISVVRWILAVDVRCGKQSSERVVLIVTARGTGRRRRISIIIREWKEEAIRWHLEVGYNEYWFKIDSALHLKIDQFKELKSELSATTAELKTDICELGTGQEALKIDICAELNSDMSNIRTDIMTQVEQGGQLYERN